MEPRLVTVTDKPLNLAPKAIAAWAWPTVATALTAAVMWVITGGFNEQELRVALGGELLAIISGIGAYFGKAAPTVDVAVRTTGTEEDTPRRPGI